MQPSTPPPPQPMQFQCYGRSFRTACSKFGPIHIIPIGIPEVWLTPILHLCRPVVHTRVSRMSLDPAMRGWMNNWKSYIAPVKLGDVMRANGVGYVLTTPLNCVLCGCPPPPPHIASSVHLSVFKLQVAGGFARGGKFRCEERWRNFGVISPSFTTAAGIVFPEKGQA